jgi:hypothetical protein
MKTRGSRGRVRRKAVWGTETSEPVAGSYEPTHGRTKVMRILSHDAGEVPLGQAINRLVISDSTMSERSRGMP